MPRHTVLPRAPANLPPAVRGPPRGVRGGPATRTGRRAVRLHPLHVPIDGQPVPGTPPWRRHAPLFLPDGRGRPRGPSPSRDRPTPEPTEVADARELALAPGRSLH